MKRNLTIGSCPAGPEFDALVKNPEIGRINAIREWIEQDGEVRSEAVVLAEVRERSGKTQTEELPSIISEKTQNEFDKRLRASLLDFVKGLNIAVDEDADSLLDTYDWEKGSPLAGFDMLQKFLALRRDVSPETVRLQVANIVYSFLGRKSKISTEIWNSIKQWSKYQKFYDMYDRQGMETLKGEDPDAQYDELSTENMDPSIENKWAHKQVIIHFLAEALEVGADMKAFTSKRKNVDIDKEYFEKLGYKDPFEKKWYKRLWNKFVNWLRNLLYGTKIEKFTENRLIEMALEIADDVYKKDYTKFIRGLELREDGTLFDTKKNEELEQKNYDTTIAKDPYAYGIIQSFQKNPYIQFFISGSLSLRKFGTLFRSVNEDLHDIDGVIPFEIFRNEANSLRFLTWIRNKGLQLQWESRNALLDGDKFFRAVKPFIEEQNWYKNVTTLYPTWELTNAFIGRDHKKGESITIQGTIEHPTEKDPKDPTKPRKYVIDFFLRTQQSGNFPEKFDVSFKDWKEIFEAKINMGRAKDIGDLIYWRPFQPDKKEFKFMNKSFRYFTFDREASKKKERKSASLLPFQRVATIKESKKNFTVYDTSNNKEQVENNFRGVKVLRIDEFLNVSEETDRYDQLLRDFTQTTGLVFDMNNRTVEGLETQDKFYDFLKIQNIRGLVYDGQYNNNAIVSFYPQIDSRGARRSEVAYNRNNYYHRSALDKFKRQMDSYDYYISEKGWIPYELSSSDVSRIQGFIRASFAPDNWEVRKVKENLWYIAGYKGKNVFSPDYYSPSTRFRGSYRFNTEELTMNDIKYMDQAMSQDQPAPTMPNTKRVYRGTPVSDQGKEFLYFSMDRAEAQDYGDVSEYDVSTEGFLNVFSQKSEYYALTDGFKKETGSTFDLFDNSEEGMETQKEFFSYAKKKGWKGLDYTGYSDSKYLISFYSDSVRKVDSQGAVNENQIRQIESLNQVSALADALSNQLGVGYKIISIEDAKRITENSFNPYSGEVAFFYDNTVYFVGPHITKDIVLHEFAHPLVRAVGKSNMVLFKKLYTDLINTPEGQDIKNEVTDLYKEWAEDDPMFMEEVMVRAIELKAMRKMQDKGSTKGFLAFIKEILFEIKQMLRRVAAAITKVAGLPSEAGKIDVSKLDENTTLDKLAGMLASGKAFNIKQQPSSMKDKKIAYSKYVRQQQEEIQSLAQVASPDLMEIATQGMRTTSRILKRMKKEKNYSEMVEVLKDEFGKSNIEEIRSNLRPHTEFMERKVSEMVDNVEANITKVESLVNTYFRLNDSLKKMTSHLKSIVSDIDDPNNLARAMSYQRVIRTWKSFIEYTLDVFDKNDLARDNAIYKLVSSIQQEINKAESYMSEIKSSALVRTFIDVMAPFNVSAKERFDQMLATYKKYNYGKKAYDRLYIEYYGLTEDEYNEFEKMKGTSAEMSKRFEYLKQKSFTGARITQEKVEAILSGDMSDVNWISSYFEGYLYNEDPVVGGLALFVKRALDETLLKSQMTYNQFANEMVPLLESVGYNPRNIGELGEKVSFVDSYGVNRDGELKQYKVWTLLNPWKDYRWATDQLNQKIKDARDEHYRLNTKSTEETLNNALREKEQHDLMYMHNVYVPDFYRIRSDFTDNGKNTSAVNALRLRDEVLARIRNLQERMSPNKDSIDDYEDTKDEIDYLWDEYRQLHSLHRLDGTMKEDAELKTAQELQRFRDMSSKFYEYNLIEGSFENALFAYEQKLINKKITGDEFKRLRARWIRKNTRVQILPEYWQKRRDLLQRKREILEQVRSKSNRDSSQQRISDELDAAYQKMFDLSLGFKDDDYQIEGTAMSTQTLENIKEQQELINDLRDELIGPSGLTRKERERLIELESKDFLTDKEESEMGSLLNRRNTSMTIAQRRELRSIFKELDELSSTEPTDYYVMEFNNLLSVVASDPKSQKVMDLLKGHYGTTHLDKEDLNELIDTDDTNRLILTELLNFDVFRNWFELSHTSRVEYDYDLDDNAVVHRRTYAWNVTRPNDPKYYKSFEIKDENGKVVEKINRVPNRRFYKRDVKKEFYTGYDPNLENPDGTFGDVSLVVGEHIDNKGRWLPRQDVANNIYRNENYYNLEKTDPRLFEVLKGLTKWSLKFQEDLMDNSSKLYLDLPRFEKSTLEVAQTKNKKKEEISKWRLMIKNIKQFFTGAQDEPESGFGWSDQFKVAQLDIFDDEGNEEYSAPVGGLYDIELDDVSTDVTNSLLRYMFNAHKSAKLTEIQPIAGALKDVLDGKGFNRFKSVAKMHLSNDGEFTSRNKDGNKIRREIVQNFIDREFNGETLTGPYADNKTVYQLSNGIFQAASLGFFAFNVTSAIKNYSGQAIQGFTEAAAGKYYNIKDWGYATGWSFKTMGELSFQIYKTGPKSLNVQLWEIFDPMLEYEGKAQKEGMSRTLFKDLTQPSGVAMNFRKWTEIQSQMQVWAAMMHNVVVKQNGNDIRLINAWEVVDGRVQLKEGVDPDWGITYDNEGKQIIGEKFLQKRQEMQAVLAKLQGAYDNFNQPEAHRLMAFRFINFMRRYFVPMFIDRFGFKIRNGRIQARAQYGLGNMAEGFYITLLKKVGDVLRMGPKALISATPDERRAFLKTFADSIILYLLGWMLGALYGWIEGDDERYEKLRQKSGPLPGPFIAESEYDFNLRGWLANHGLTMAMQVRAEQAQFIPWPGLGLRNYKELLTEWASSAAIGPTIGTAFTLAQDLSNLVTGNEKAYYQKPVGPYDWQQEGGIKAIAHMAKSAGFTGTFFQAELGAKKQESIEAGFASGGN